MGPMLMMDSGCEGHGTEGAIMDCGAFRMYWPCRFLKKMAGEGGNGLRNKEIIKKKDKYSRGGSCSSEVMEGMCAKHTPKTTILEPHS